MHETLAKFSNETTAHGIRHAWNARPMPVRVVWAVIVLGAFGFLVYQYVHVFWTYFSYPVKFRVEMKYGKLDFPSVTVCNKNPIKQSRLPPEVEQMIELRYGSKLNHTAESAFHELLNNLKNVSLNATENNATLPQNEGLHGIIITLLFLFNVHLFVVTADF